MHSRSSLVQRLSVDRRVPAAYASHAAAFIRYTTAVMPHSLALAVELVTTFLAVAGMGYFLAALVAARVFLASRRVPLATFTPGVSILKSLKGLDPEMLAAFRSHCRQTYAGEFEMLFGLVAG